MEVELRGFEVLEIAEKIERNGVRFYRRAAELVGDAKASRIFLELADWEQQHIQVFLKMREDLTEQGWTAGAFEPAKLDWPDAQAIAGLAVFGIHGDPGVELTGSETRDEIFRMARKKEEDSIIYYSGLKDFMPRPADVEVIDRVIQEEMRHMRILNQALGQSA